MQPANCTGNTRTSIAKLRRDSIAHCRHPSLNTVDRRNQECPIEPIEVESDRQRPLQPFQHDKESEAREQQQLQLRC
jgi:hypothetical protein